MRGLWEGLPARDIRATLRASRADFGSSQHYRAEKCPEIGPIMLRIADFGLHGPYLADPQAYDL